MSNREIKFEVVTLCGSTRFIEDFRALESALVRTGFLVFSVGFFHHSEEGNFTQREKEIVDSVHMVKISRSDFVICINKGNYIGDSTQREIDQAFRLTKKIYFYDSKRTNPKLFMRDLLVDRGYIY